jgi:hypothetical protein
MPGPALGLRTLFGTGEETTYGTAAAVDRRYELVSESLSRRNQILQPQGISGAHTARRGSRRVLSAQDGGGDLTMEVAATGFGRWLKHMVGGTPTVVQQAATTAYLHTYPHGPLNGKSLTVQKSLRDGDGTEVETFTFLGCKVATWSLSIAVEQILQLQLTLDSQDVVANVANSALAALPIPTSALFNFKQGALLVAGAQVARVLDATVDGDNSLKTASYFIGSGGKKAEPDVTNFREVTGNLTYEFTDPVPIYDRFVADSAATLKLEFVGENIAGAHNERLTLNIPQIHFTGDTPQVGGPNLVTVAAPFEAALNAAGDPLCTFEYMTTDTAA